MNFEFLFSLLSYPLFVFLSDFGGVVLKEIKIHSYGNTQQQVAIKRGFAKHFIKMIAGAMDLTDEPGHAVSMNLADLFPLDINLLATTVQQRLPLMFVIFLIGQFYDYPRKFFKFGISFHNGNGDMYLNLFFQQINRLFQRAKQPFARTK